MNIDTRPVGSVTILDIHGKITHEGGSKEIKSKVGEVLEGGNKNILLNLGDVSFIDSTGIGELVGAYTSVTNEGGQLKLLNLTKKVKEILVITKLLTVFDCFDDESSAIQSFS